uniref:Attractin-like protein 1 n=1 Tax=Phallusia mammillata TaxID=59560 RepID=A0A6F9D6Q6_9ASCI|nr:attractin-like protein 1 [Phallusia mammillata]
MGLFLHVCLGAAFLCNMMFGHVLSFCHNTDIVASKNEESKCFMGTCTNSTCICTNGWGGSLCDYCHGRVMVNQSSGYITDGPHPYLNSSACSWLIKPAIKHSSLKLTLLEFGSECGWDYLYIYDGDSAFSPLIGTYSGLVAINETTHYPELLAKSGTAFLQFYSDVAYRLSGFNISYSIDTCLYNCSDRGVCTDGVCICDDGWSGVACKYQVNAETKDWLALSIPPNITPRASFDVASDIDVMWMYGGFAFEDPYSELVAYNASTEKWLIIENNGTFPPSRYSHSMVFYDNKLLVFGGKLCENETSVNDLWEFDTTLSTWRLVSYNTTFDNVPGQYHSSLTLSGHSANLVKLSNTSEFMFVFFGYHPFEEYSSFVYKYNPTQKLWSRPKLFGKKISGFYGHSSAYDEYGSQIYVHGGYGVSGLSQDTFVYNPRTNWVRIVKNGGGPRYLHSAVFYGWTMYVFGGNTHNDTSQSTGALCYSSDFLTYNSYCNRWKYVPTPNFTVDFERFGHKAVVLTTNGLSNIFVTSGYNGKMIPNILTYNPVPCHYHQANESICNGTFDEGQCIWDSGKCVSTSSIVDTVNLNIDPLCRNLSHDDFEKKCQEYSGCEACLSNLYNCTYCEDKNTCHYSKNNPSCLSKCNDDNYCSKFKNCFQCESFDSKCKWVNGQCKNGSTAQSVCNINSTCYQQLTCSDCTKHSNSKCMWCLNKNQCIQTNSYVVHFPYGQCFEWTNVKQTCRDYNCSSLKTCTLCQRNSKCGWCDDGTETGRGFCLNGADQGPIAIGNTHSNEKCLSKSWYFSTCPSCQCNGHSKCFANGTCIHCENNTSGLQCQRCSEGYFGEALNGGSCQECACNNKATNCHALSGNCFCFTKGVVGNFCEKCDYSSGYIGNATNNGTCYYKLTENYQFQFTFTIPADEYITGINFQNTPVAQDDVQMSFESEKPVTITLGSSVTSQNEAHLTVEAQNVSSLQYTFNADQYSLGTNLNSTILIHVTDIQVPCRIKISLIQRSNRLLHILLILFSSFLVILFMAALTWKLKIMYDAYRLRATRAVELKQMAARPFAGMNLICDELLVKENACSPQSEINLNAETALCEEKCSTDSVCLMTVVLCMPSESEDTENTKQYSFEANIMRTFGKSSFMFGTTLALEKSRRLKMVCESQNNTYNESFLQMLPSCKQNSS